MTLILEKIKETHYPKIAEEQKIDHFNIFSRSSVYECVCPFSSASQSVNLLSSVSLPRLPITSSVEDNMAPLGSVKWPMCHHQFFAATAIPTIITAIIISLYRETTLHLPEQSTTPHKQYLCICTLPATAIIITDLESVIIFLQSQTSEL